MLIKTWFKCVKNEKHSDNAKKMEETLELKDLSIPAKRKCNYCGKGFKSRISTSIHVRKMHENTSPVQNFIARRRKRF